MARKNAERKFLLFDGPGGAMGIGFFVLASGLVFRAEALNFFVCVPPPVFGGVFALFGGDFAFFFVVGDFAFWGVFSRYAAIISRAARKTIWFPPPRGAVSKT